MLIKLIKDTQFGEEPLTEVRIVGEMPRVDDHLRWGDRLYLVTKVTHEFPFPRAEVLVRLT